jgi:hypothetical protein
VRPKEFALELHDEIVILNLVLKNKEARGFRKSVSLDLARRKWF